MATIQLEEVPGAGSINIFYRESYQNTGSITASGVKRNAGGAGGAGSITVGSIATGTFVSK